MYRYTDAMTQTPTSIWQPSRKPIRNAADQVMVDLRNRILSGELAAGAKLPTEKELSAAYGVSGNTVREAIRGLATSLLVEVRHGSGAYVTAEVNTLMAETLRSVIKIESVGVSDVLATYGAVNAVAAELAASHATPEQIEHMQEALDSIPRAANASDISDSLLRFRSIMADASGNRLLASICRFLAGIQIGLAVQLMGSSFDSQRQRASQLTKERQSLLDAIRLGDPLAARRAARRYQERAVFVLTATDSTSPAPELLKRLRKLLSSDTQ